MKLHLQNVWWRMVCVALITMAAVAVSIEVRASGSAETDPLSLSNPARHNDVRSPDGISEQAWGKIVRQIKADRYNISIAPSPAGSEETIDPLVTAGEIKLTASPAAAYDNFGVSVAISGDTVVVGADGNEDAGSYSGSAYIFSRNFGGADNWGQVKKLTRSDASSWDYFGHSVAISGDTVVVGAYYKGSYSGSAYIFSRNRDGVDNWGEVKKLTASDAAEGDHFGVSVAISGDTVVVGADGNDDAGTSSGSAYIFSRNRDGVDNWGEVKKLTASDAAEGDHFGVSVAISGDTVVVGAHGNDDAGTNSGSAYIFSRNSGGADNWGEVKKLTASDAAEGDLFGYSVAISGDTVVVGAYFSDDAGSESGSAYIFSRNSGGADNWGQVKKLTRSDAEAGDWFGHSVAISGDTVVVGAPYNNGAVSRSGSAYMFSRNFEGADNWGQVKKLIASDTAEYDHFGDSVAISGDSVLVGAYGNDDAGAASGAAYLYTLAYGQWTQQKKQSAASAEFGWSLDINEDMLAVGAPDDGTNGAVYLFYRNNASGADTWEQKHKINGYAAGEQFGFSVALGGDKLVVGAPYNAVVEGKDGAAYVFYRNFPGLDSWGQKRKLTGSDGGGLFGWAVSLSGDKVAVGAPSNWYFAGSAYLFYRNNTSGADTWEEVRRINASDPWALSQFGYTISLSGDTLAVGAPFHDSQKGAVYIFPRNFGGTDNWGQVQKKMAGDAAEEDHFGYGLSLNHDQLVVGAPDEDSQGADSGAVYVFYRNSGSTADSWGQAKKKLLPGDVEGHQFGWSVKNNSDAALVGAKGGGAAYLLERNEGGGDQWGIARKFTPADSAVNFGFSLAMDGNVIAIGADSAAYIFQRNILASVYYVDLSGLCNGYTPCYFTIQAAVVSAGSGVTIKIRQGTYTESITLNESKTVTLQGGWDTVFQNQTGTTTLRQAPKAPQGSLTLQMLNIKPQ
jgi:hypothetical protein